MITNLLWSILVTIFSGPIDQLKIWCISPFPLSPNPLFDIGMQQGEWFIIRYLIFLSFYFSWPHFIQMNMSS